MVSDKTDKIEIGVFAVLFTLSSLMIIYNAVFVSADIGGAEGISNCTYIIARGNYTFNHSVTVYNGTINCISVLVANVTIECNYSRLVASNGSTGKYAIWINSSNVTIKNCIFDNWTYGVGILSNNVAQRNITNVTIMNNTFLNIRQYAILTNGTSNKVNLSWNNISVTGATGIGIYVNNSNYTTIRNNNITTNGTGGYGIYLYKSRSNRTIIGQNNITTFGNYGHGIYLHYSNVSNITRNNITIKGNYSIGILLNESNRTIMDQLKINISGNYSYGIQLQSTVATNISESNITTSGGYGYGIYFGLGNNSNNNITRINITTSGAYGYGIYLTNANESNLDTNYIYTKNNYGFGIYIYNTNNTELDTNNITTRGNYSYGHYLVGSSYIAINASAVLASGKNNSYGVYFDTSKATNITRSKFKTPNSQALYLTITKNMIYFNHSVISSTEAGNAIFYTFNNKSSGTKGKMTTQTLGQIVIANSSNMSLGILTMNHSDGIMIVKSFNITINASTIRTNITDTHAISAYYTNNSTINRANITTTGPGSYGLYLYNSHHMTITGNSFNSTKQKSIYVTDSLIKSVYYNHTMGGNNQTGRNNYSIWYMYGNTSISNGNKSLGQLIIAFTDKVNVTNVSVINDDGIQLIKANRTKLSYCKVNMSNTYDNAYGIHVLNSSSVNVSNNLITTTSLHGYGLYLQDDSDSGDYDKNNITTTGASGYGIKLVDASNNTIERNRVKVTSTTDAYVVYLLSTTGGNTISNNFFNYSGTSSTKGVGVYIGTNIANNWYQQYTHSPDIGNIIGNEYIGGNYWTNKSADGYSDDCSDNDGDYICDTLINLSAGILNRDLYPLANSTLYTTTTSNPSSSPVTSPETITSTDNKIISIINAGKSETIKGFTENTGIESIKITVTNTASNVKVSVSKYSTKPANVSKAKEGAVYGYLEINVQNLENKLDNALIKLKVPKSWLTTNNLERDKVALFKFAGNDWTKLNTNFDSEDNENNYYTASVNSFSYFAIAGITEEATLAPPEEEEKEEEPSSNWWIWVISAVAGLIIAGIIAIRQKKR